MQKFKCLYWFSSSELDVLEVKRLDRLEGSPLSEIYKWLVVSEKKVLELDFKSMDKNGSEEFREFIEGSLRFNDENASLRLLGKEYVMIRKNADASDKLNQVASYLEKKLHHEGLFSFRDLKPSDVNFFKDWVSDQEVIRYSMTKFHRIMKSEEVVQWFHSTIFDSKTFQVGIIDPATKDLIGYAGIATLNEIDNNGEYFIFIGNKSYWGKGIASKVTKLIVEAGFRDLKLHRIFLTASSKNPGAIRAYEKAGFIHEGRMREAFYRNNEFSDKVIMGILNTTSRRDS